MLLRCHVISLTDINKYMFIASTCIALRTTRLFHLKSFKFDPPIPPLMTSKCVVLATLGYFRLFNPSYFTVFQYSPQTWMYRGSILLDLWSLLCWCVGSIWWLRPTNMYYGFWQIFKEILVMFTLAWDL